MDLNTYTLSSCMGPSDWIKIASNIEAAYFNYDGFVIIMGTGYSTISELIS